LFLIWHLSVAVGEQVMLVERGSQVMNVESVSEAYVTASNYLRRIDVIADVPTANERLFGIIMEMFEAGEFNKIKLANKAIAHSRSPNCFDP
jgi:hypothetical protein